MVKAQQAASALNLLRAAEERRIEVMTSFAPVFGELGAQREFVRAVARHTRSLQERGVLATVAEVA